jgi:hypothetical protein
MKTIILATSMFVSAFGCSTLPRQEVHHVATLGAESSPEMRGAGPVRAKRAKALLSGPAMIKHLETDGEGVVTLYLTDDPGIGDRACPSAAGEDASAVAVLGQRSRVTDLVVPEGKRICAVVTGGRSMNVTWHAEAVTETYRKALELALSSGG